MGNSGLLGVQAGRREVDWMVPTRGHERAQEGTVGRAML